MIKKRTLKISIILCFCIIFSVLFFLLIQNNIQFTPINDIYYYSSVNFNNKTFDIAKISQEKINNIKFFFKDEKDQKFNDFTTLKNHLKEKNETLIFATNGGIFSKTGNPMGLYIENNKKIFEIDESDGEGNFYLKPNGIFLIKDNEAKIIETSEFQDDSNIIYALQSGPLLVQNDSINPAFKENSQNKYIRSGVGIREDGSIIFVISNGAVTFYEFASFFKDELHCKNALYLDGAISEMFVSQFREYNDKEFGAIIGITD